MSKLREDARLNKSAIPFRVWILRVERFGAKSEAGPLRNNFEFGYGTDLYGIIEYGHVRKTLTVSVREYKK